ncbi:Hypothetical protein, putative [Bodo saltans]|uniref:Uncharacterized protein n=1 Tax=Bodo saltans TaxID=75058 RepID=A0A0S4KFP3_BODSA|nr:Hypothetical protein, putative [Bodo saltans]|eukprot:CUI12388.1 Hypothetical protein, putative [Bodo saltans]
MRMQKGCKREVLVVTVERECGNGIARKCAINCQRPKVRKSNKTSCAQPKPYHKCLNRLPRRKSFFFFLHPKYFKKTR